MRIRVFIENNSALGDFAKEFPRLFTSIPVGEFRMFDIHFTTRQDPVIREVIMWLINNQYLYQEFAE